MKRKSERMFLRSCGFTENQYDFIEEVSETEGISFNEVVRDAVNEYKMKLKGADDEK